MNKPLTSETGVSLIETMIAMLVLTIGAVGMAATFLQGMRMAGGSPAEVIATAKAAEAIESVYSARDSHTIVWDKLRNKSKGGIFLDTAEVIKTGGKDGIVNTGDDGELVETVTLPGPDNDFSKGGDNRTETLANFKRQITITDLSNVLRSVTVTISYTSGGATQTYTLTTYISAFA
jgi:type II secretory pathway pseudopilin PulG